MTDIKFAMYILWGVERSTDIENMRWDLERAFHLLTCRRIGSTIFKLFPIIIWVMTVILKSP